MQSKRARVRGRATAAREADEDDPRGGERLATLARRAASQLACRRGSACSACRPPRPRWAGRARARQASGQKDTHAGRAAGRAGCSGGGTHVLAAPWHQHGRSLTRARPLLGRHTAVDDARDVVPAGRAAENPRGAAALRGLRTSSRGPAWILARAALLASFVVKPGAPPRSLGHPASYTTTRFQPQKKQHTFNSCSNR